MLLSARMFCMVILDTLAEPGPYLSGTGLVLKLFLLSHTGGKQVDMASQVA